MENSVFTFDSPRIQQFSLPSNIIYYLNRNKEYPKVLQKLQQSCKYFFARNKLLIVEEDGCFNEDAWPEFSIKNKRENLSKSNAKFMFIYKLYICLIGLNPNIDKNLCSKIFYNNITLLRIYFTTLNLSDYEILASSKCLTDVDIQHCVILNEEKNHVQLDEIFNFTPNIAIFRCIKSTGNTITNQILKNMLANITENCIEKFSVSGCFLSSFFDPNLLCEFIKKAAAPKAIFRFSISFDSDEQKQQISTALFQMLEEWNIPEQRAQIELGGLFPFILYF
uniref:Uncharacterized protein n=1 Tax=Panagrolaimus davidi TaxID=227884 RepID=A0A914Q1A3_9BILA